MGKVRLKLEYENQTGIWHDVYEGGKLLVYDTEDEARAALRERFPVEVQMEQYAGGKHTRVIRILPDEYDWPKRS